MESQAPNQHRAVTGPGPAVTSARLGEPPALAVLRSSGQEPDFGLIPLAGPGQRQHTLLRYCSDTCTGRGAVFPSLCSIQTLYEAQRMGDNHLFFFFYLRGRCCQTASV